MLPQGEEGPGDRSPGTGRGRDGRGPRHRARVRAALRGLRRTGRRERRRRRDRRCTRPTRTPPPTSCARSRPRAAKPSRTAATSRDSAVGDALVARALDTWGRLDIVINNAGFGRPRMVFNLSDEEWDDVIRVHLRGTFVVSRPACRYWRAQAKEHGTTLRASSSTPRPGCSSTAAPGSRTTSRPRRACRRSPRPSRPRWRRTASPRTRSCPARHAARADRMAHGPQHADDATPDAARSTRAIRCTSASSARTSRHRTRAGSPGQTFQVRGGIVEHIDTWSVRDHGAARRPGLHRRRLPRRDPAPVRRGRETRGSAAARLEGELAAVRLTLGGPSVQSDLDFSDFLESSSSE